MSKNILIVDDEADIREMLSDILVDEGYETTLAASASAAMQALKEEVPAAVVLDIWLEGSGMDGIGVLKHIKMQYPEVPVIMVSGHGNIETAIQTMKFGAYDFLEKPFQSEKLLILIQRAIESACLAAENRYLRAKDGGCAELIGTSKAVQTLSAEALAVAPTNSRIVIIGERSCGKGVLANFIHDHSKRQRWGFYTLNVNHDQAQVERTLFGYEDDKTSELGLLHRADNGTLYIDEISALSSVAQAKLLSFLQTGKFKLEGSGREESSDVRIIAGTSVDLEQEIATVRINTTLYYRLNVTTLRMEPLARRAEDIKPLATHFLQRFAQDFGVTEKQFSEESWGVIMAYDWPGSVRQMSNVIESIYLSSQSQQHGISINMLPKEIIAHIDARYQDLNPTNSEMLSKEIKSARESFEREYLVAQLQRFSGNVSKTASFIKMDRTALHRKIKMLNIDLEASNSNSENADDVSNF